MVGVGRRGREREDDWRPESAEQREHEKEEERKKKDVRHFYERGGREKRGKWIIQDLMYQTMDYNTRVLPLGV